MVDASLLAHGALGHAVASAEVTGRTPITYDPFLPGRSVERVVGEARLPSGAAAPWSAVVKRSTGAGLRAAERELAAYEGGVATDRGHGSLTAPRLLASTRTRDSVEVWLEDLHDAYGGDWPPERFGVAARHIAAWDAADVPRLTGFDGEDSWAERHGQPHRTGAVVAELRVLREKPRADVLMELLGDDGFRRTATMVTTTPTRIDALSRLPQTLLHHDLVRSNLFAVSGGRTAAIDWENVGYGPPGVDLAPLVVGSVRRGEASADDLAAIEELVLEAYQGFWASTGHPVAEVRAAYRLALGLRWHVVLGTITAWLDPTVTRIRGSRPAEPRDESLRHLLALARHLLDAAVPSG